jgi:hypothetical protein
MGMTLDEAFYCLSNDKYACSKCRHLCSKHNCRKEAVDMVTETRRKYQRIQEIINNTDYIEEDVIRYKMICEVIEDGNDD